MKILGVDPGTSRIGFAVIERHKESRTPLLMRYGLIEIKEPTLQEKLKVLGTLFEELLEKEVPTHAVLERLFFAKNRKTAMDVAHARGLLLNLLVKRGIPVLEVGPSEVKAAIAGDGAADKESLRKMVEYTLGSKLVKGHDDVSDAVALALTGYYYAGRSESYK